MKKYEYNKDAIKDGSKMEEVVEFRVLMVNIWRRYDISQMNVSFIFIFSKQTWIDDDHEANNVSIGKEVCSEIVVEARFLTRRFVLKGRVAKKFLCLDFDSSVTYEFLRSL